MRDRWQEDQDARRRGVVQVRPGQLDLLQLAQAVRAEGINSALVAGLVRVCSELTVHLSPSDPLRSPKREGPVDQP